MIMIIIIPTRSHSTACAQLAPRRLAGSSVGAGLFWPKQAPMTSFEIGEDDDDDDDGGGVGS